MAKKSSMKITFNMGLHQFSISEKKKGQCVLCYKVLDHHSLRLLKLKLHLEKVHSNYKDKDVNFFKRKKDTVKRQSLDSTGEF